jgi:hypothetical protein
MSGRVCAVHCPVIREKGRKYRSNSNLYVPFRPKSRARVLGGGRCATSCGVRARYQQG